jgi:hypothetical protein
MKLISKVLIAFVLAIFILGVAGVLIGLFTGVRWNDIYALIEYRLTHHTQVLPLYIPRKDVRDGMVRLP